MKCEACVANQLLVCSDCYTVTKSHQFHEIRTKGYFNVMFFQKKKQSPKPLSGDSL